jgi:hypothetical protein
MWAPFYYKNIMWVLSYGRSELRGALKSFETILLSSVFPLAPRFRFLAVLDCIGFHAPDRRASLQSLGRIVFDLSCFQGVLETRRRTNKSYHRHSERSHWAHAFKKMLNAECV